MSGYSGTPLCKKLGIKPGFKLYLIDHPADYLDLLGELPDGLIFMDTLAQPPDLIHFFVKTVSELEAQLPFLKDKSGRMARFGFLGTKKAPKFPQMLMKI